MIEDVTAPHEIKIDARCPACRNPELLMIVIEIDIPHFGRMLETTLRCQNCGFKHANLQSLEEHPPMRYEFFVKGDDDLCVRVVRSSTSTLRIPELGVVIEPGVACEGFVSNVEGVLTRVEDIVKGQYNTTENAKTREKCTELLKKIADIKKGKENVTIIIDDPFGNSVIVSERAKKRKLTKKELDDLTTGVTIIDI